MREMFAIEGDYAVRCKQLIRNRVALWDVLASSIRPGSMDADIQTDSAQANDFDSFLRAHSSIRLIAFNGRKAEALFEKLVDAQSIAASIRRVSLPSTSPAFAAMSFVSKMAAWREAIHFDTIE